MADSTITLTVQKQIVDGMYKVLGTLAIEASPATYPTGGYVVSLAKSDIKSQRLPRKVEIQGTSGYVYRFIPGTTNANGKIMVYTGAAAQSALTELSAGATPAGVSGDVIGFEAQYDGML